MLPHVDTCRPAHTLYTPEMAELTVGCVAQLAERRSLAGEMILSCARPVDDG